MRSWRLVIGRSVCRPSEKSLSSSAVRCVTRCSKSRLRAARDRADRDHSVSAADSTMEVMVMTPKKACKNSTACSVLLALATKGPMPKAVPQIAIVETQIDFSLA